MRYLSLLATVLFVIAVPVLLVTANIRYLMGDVGFYERGLRKYDAVEATGIALEELDRASAEIISYFEDDSETLRVIVIVDGQETSLFNSRETRHMEDVKRLVRFMFRLNEISLGFVVIYVAAVVLWSRERSLRRLAGETLAAVGFAFTVLVSTTIFFLVLGFHDAWDQMHRVAFPSGFWQLNPRTDRLIQMFPEDFWAESTVIAGGLSFASFAVLVLLAGGYLAFSRPRKPLLSATAEAEAASSVAGTGEFSGDATEAADPAEAGDATSPPESEGMLSTPDELEAAPDETAGSSERD